MTNKDENKDINKEDSLENQENNSQDNEDIKKNENKPDLDENITPEDEKPALSENTDNSDDKNIESDEQKNEEEVFNNQENIENQEVPKSINNSEENISSEEEEKEDKAELPSETNEQPPAEEENLGILPVQEENENLPYIPDEKLKRKSNYQISLVDENHLRAKVMTGKLVSVDCYVKEKYLTEERLGERQTNKILVHPDQKPHEIEIMISVGIEPPKEGVEIEPGKGLEKESNYQVSLVDENLLRIQIVTEKSVSIDCSVKDKDIQSDISNETQANKIFIHAKEKPQDVEIIVAIGSGVQKEMAVPSGYEERTVTAAAQKNKLTPNPVVANLIQKFSEMPGEYEEDFSKTPEERLEEKLGPKNPWRLYKEMMQRNLIAGLVGAVLLYAITITSFYSYASKKNENADVIEAPRLIVMQDIAENQFQQQNVEDPNKPKEEEKPSDDGTNTNKVPPIVPKKIKPPRVIGPPRHKVDTTSTALDKELDSLRKVSKNLTSNNNGTPDTTNKKLNGNNNPIPDSLMRELKENEVGLTGNFPTNWQQLDSRAINQTTDFSGVMLVDTLPVKKAERLSMSVQIDKNNEYWKQFNFKNIFAQDSLKNIIYSIEPKEEGSQTYYRFYISGMAYNIFINAFIDTPYFDKHKTEIEQVVRTIKIKKPDKTVPPSGGK